MQYHPQSCLVFLSLSSSESNDFLYQPLPLSCPSCHLPSIWIPYNSASTESPGIYLPGWLDPIQLYKWKYRKVSRLSE